MPDFKVEIRARLAELQLSPVREAEIVEELSQHLEETYDRALSGGASEKEAHEKVMGELNTADLLRRELKHLERPISQDSIACGTRQKINLFADLGQDVRYGLRTLAKNPAFTAIAVVVLALGIGANSAIFSVVDAVLLRPLPFKNPGQLVMVWENAAHLGFPRDTPSPANFLDWQKQATGFTGMAAMIERSFNLTGIGEPERLEGRRVSGNLFQLLGISTRLGRTFVPEDDKAGTHVVLLSHSLWQRRFGSDPGVIGRALTLDGESYSVVGVMPPLVQLPGYENVNDQLWVPIAFPAEEAAQRGNHFLEVIARLKPGISLKQAQAEMDTIAARLEKQYPTYNLRRGAVVVPLHEQVVGDIKPALLILAGAVGFVLLIACANVANLLLARAASLQKEIAVRLALGASRFRIVRQLLVESLLLSGLGSGGGLLLAVWIGQAIRALGATQIPRAEQISIDSRALAFTLLLSFVTGLIFGLAPAWRAARANLNEALKEGARSAQAGSRQRLRNALIVAEVALSLILLVGAGLLIKSFWRLQQVEPGFDPHNLLSVEIRLPSAKYGEREQSVAFYKQMLERVKSLPGVLAAAIVNHPPFSGRRTNNTFHIEGRPESANPSDLPRADYRTISPDYFR